MRRGAGGEEVKVKRRGRCGKVKDVCYKVESRGRCKEVCGMVG